MALSDGTTPNSLGGTTWWALDETAATADLDGAWSSSTMDASRMRSKLLYFRNTSDQALTVKVMSLSSRDATDARQIGGNISLGAGNVTPTENWVHLTDHHPFLRIDVTSGGAASTGTFVVKARSQGA